MDNLMNIAPDSLYTIFDFLSVQDLKDVAITCKFLNRSIEIFIKKRNISLRIPEYLEIGDGKVINCLAVDAYRELQRNPKQEYFIRSSQHFYKYKAGAWYGGSLSVVDNNQIIDVYPAGVYVLAITFRRRGNILHTRAYYYPNTINPNNANAKYILSFEKNWNSIKYNNNNLVIDYQRDQIVEYLKGRETSSFREALQWFIKDDVSTMCRDKFVSNQE